MSKLDASKLTCEFYIHSINFSLVISLGAFLWILYGNYESGSIFNIYLISLVVGGTLSIIHFYQELKKKWTEVDDSYSG